MKDFSQGVRPNATTGTPAPYGHACKNCAKAKCKCIYNQGGTDCERYVHYYTCQAILCESRSKWIVALPEKFRFISADPAEDKPSLDPGRTGTLLRRRLSGSTSTSKVNGRTSRHSFTCSSLFGPVLKSMVLSTSNFMKLT